MMGSERRRLMSIPIDPDKAWKVLDDAGQTQALLLPGEALHHILADREALRKEVAALREELAALKAERDEYRNTMHYLSHEDTRISVEEIERIRRRDGIPFERVIA